MYFALSVATGFQRENGCAAREAGGGGGEGVVDQKSERLRKKYWNSFFYENILILDTKSGWFRKK